MLPEITHVIASLLANPPQGRRTITVREAVTAALASRPLSYGLTTEYALRRYRAIKRGSLRLADTRNASLWREIVERENFPPWTISSAMSPLRATSSRRSTPRNFSTGPGVSARHRADDAAVPSPNPSDSKKIPKMPHLNITSVTDEIFALTALRKVVNPGRETPELLSRDRLPALRVLVRGAFARLACRLAPCLVSAETDPENPGAERPYDSSSPLLMALDFGEPEKSLSAGSRLALKRYLEHLLALLVITDIYPPQDNPGAEEEISSLLETVVSLLSAREMAASPLRITPSRY